MKPAFVRAPKWKLKVFGLIGPDQFSNAFFSSVQVASFLIAIKLTRNALSGLLNISHFLLAFINMILRVPFVSLIVYTSFFHI